MKQILSSLLIYCLKIYKLGFSPYLGNRCRFVPSCSTYAMEALQEFGLIKGMDLVLKRLGSCHPWGRSGFDPIPKAK